MALALLDDPEGKKHLAVELYDRFHAMKTYGKEPESLESITRIFSRDLAAYPASKILKAISTHAQRSNEFPTVADITGLILRNGRLPLKESDIIAIRKKDGEFRTPDEWQMLRQWDSQQQEGWRDEPDEHKEQATLAETVRLRKEVASLRNENQRLADLLATAKTAALVKPIIPEDEKTRRTVEYLRSIGAPEGDVFTFLEEDETRSLPDTSACTSNYPPA